MTGNGGEAWHGRPLSELVTEALPEPQAGPAGPSGVILARLAVTTAALMDQALAEGDARLWYAGAARLTGWLTTLGVLGVSSDSGDAIPAGLADALGAGPEIRHTP